MSPSATAKAWLARRPRLAGRVSAARSLTTRLVLAIMVTAIATFLVVGVPTAHLLMTTLERQAQVRLEQAARVTHALVAADQSDVAAHATLIAQRPTLRAYLERGETPSASYMEDLRAGAGLDVVVVLDGAGRLVAQAASPGADALILAAALAAAPTLASLPAGSGSLPTAALTAEAPLANDDAPVALGRIRVAALLNAEYATRLKEQTGVDHTLWVGPRRLATTLPGDADRYAARVALGDVGVTDEVSLPAAELQAVATQIQGLLVASATLFLVMVATLGYLLARRLTQPLRALAGASEALGWGDLSTPLPTGEGGVEVARLSQTLEQMRRRLKAAHDDLSQAKAWSESLVGALTEGVVTVDAEGRITSFSAGAEHILGWRGAEVVGRRLDVVFRPAAGVAPLNRLAPGAVARLRVLTRDERPVSLAMTGGSQVLGESTPWEQALVFRDVTEEEQALRLREFFLANVSHEFKTPLAALRAAIELLATEYPHLTEAETRELIDASLVGAVRLEELVDNLLNSASIQAGQFEIRPHPTDLASIVDGVSLTARPLLALRGQSLVIELAEGLPPVLGDARRLSQVLFNLISNAAKYGPPQRPVTITACLEGDMVWVCVIDQGAPIPRERRTEMFRPFRRPRTETDAAGVGLGLSIVKTIVERHGGQVGVGGSARGNVFWFTLPLAEGSEDARPGRG